MRPADSDAPRLEAIARIQSLREQLQYVTYELAAPLPDSLHHPDPPAPLDADDTVLWGVDEGAHPTLAKVHAALRSLTQDTASCRGEAALMLQAAQQHRQAQQTARDGLRGSLAALQGLLCEVEDYEDHQDDRSSTSNTAASTPDTKVRQGAAPASRQSSFSTRNDGRWDDRSVCTPATPLALDAARGFRTPQQPSPSGGGAANILSPLALAVLEKHRKAGGSQQPQEHRSTAAAGAAGWAGHRRAAVPADTPSLAGGFVAVAAGRAPAPEEEGGSSGLAEAVAAADTAQPTQAPQGSGVGGAVPSPMMLCHQWGTQQTLSQGSSSGSGGSGRVGRATPDPPPVSAAGVLLDGVSAHDFLGQIVRTESVCFDSPGAPHATAARPGSWASPIPAGALAQAAVEEAQAGGRGWGVAQARDGAGRPSSRAPLADSLNDSAECNLQQLSTATVPFTLSSCSRGASTSGFGSASWNVEPPAAPAAAGIAGLGTPTAAAAVAGLGAPDAEAEAGASPPLAPSSGQGVAGGAQQQAQPEAPAPAPAASAARAAPAGKGLWVQQQQGAAAVLPPTASGARQAAGWAAAVGGEGQQQQHAAPSCEGGSSAAPTLSPDSSPKDSLPCLMVASLSEVELLPPIDIAAETLLGVSQLSCPLRSSDWLISPVSVGRGSPSSGDVSPPPLSVGETATATPAAANASSAAREQHGGCDVDAADPSDSLTRQDQPVPHATPPACTGVRAAEACIVSALCAAVAAAVPCAVLHRQQEAEAEAEARVGQPARAARAESAGVLPAVARPSEAARQQRGVVEQGAGSVASAMQDHYQRILQQQQQQQRRHPSSSGSEGQERASPNTPSDPGTSPPISLSTRRNLDVLSGIDYCMSEGKTSFPASEIRDEVVTPLTEGTRNGAGSMGVLSTPPTFASNDTASPVGPALPCLPQAAPAAAPVPQYAPTSGGKSSEVLPSSAPEGRAVDVVRMQEEEEGGDGGGDGAAQQGLVLFGLQLPKELRPRRAEGEGGVAAPASGGGAGIGTSSSSGGPPPGVAEPQQQQQQQQGEAGRVGDGAVLRQPQPQGGGVGGVSSSNPVTEALRQQHLELESAFSRLGAVRRGAPPSLPPSDAGRVCTLLQQRVAQRERDAQQERQQAGAAAPATPTPSPRRDAGTQAGDSPAARHASPLPPPGLGAATPPEGLPAAGAEPGGALRVVAVAGGRCGAAPPAPAAFPPAGWVGGAGVPPSGRDRNPLEAASPRSAQPLGYAVTPCGVVGVVEKPPWKLVGRASCTDTFTPTPPVPLRRDASYSRSRSRSASPPRRAANPYGLHLCWIGLDWLGWVGRLMPLIMATVKNTCR